MSGEMRPPESGEPRPHGGEGVPQTSGEQSTSPAGGEGSRFAEAEESPEVLEKEPVYDRSRAQAERLIRENRNFIADYLDSFIEGLAAMERALDDEGRSETATQIHRVVEELRQTSSRVRGDSLMRLARQMEARARARPALAFGGAALAGFALSRVFKSRPTSQKED